MSAAARVAAALAVVAAVLGCEAPTGTGSTGDGERWGAIAYYIVYAGSGVDRRSVELRAYSVRDAASRDAAQREAWADCVAAAGSEDPCGTGVAVVYAFSTSSADEGKRGRCAAMVWANPPKPGSTVRGTGPNYIAATVGTTKAEAEANARAIHAQVPYSQLVGATCNTK